MIFTGTNTVIELDTKTDISGATVKVLYRKPDGTTGEWNAQVEETTKVLYETVPSDIDVPGKWNFQAGVTVGGKTLRGNIVQTTIQKPID